MILIADSGATKTEWRIIQGDEISQSITMGINPHYQNETKISEVLKLSIQEGSLPQKADKVFFYGAGCSSVSMKESVEVAIKNAFDCHEVEVHSDVLGVARALCGKTKGVVGLLGTGSASCYYDGKSISSQVPSLGYLLGDEGSGAHLGKLLLADYLRGKLPRDLEKKFKTKYNLDKDSVLRTINQSEYPSRFLGSFSEFIISNIHFPHIHKMVYNSFYQFMDNYVLPYPEHQSTKINFCGSIAFMYSNILTKVCSDLKLSIGKVVKSPIAGLTLYHLNKY